MKVAIIAALPLMCVLAIPITDAPDLENFIIRVGDKGMAMNPYTSDTKAADTYYAVLRERGFDLKTVPGEHDIENIIIRIGAEGTAMNTYTKDIVAADAHAVLRD